MRLRERKEQNNLLSMPGPRVESREHDVVAAVVVRSERENVARRCMNTASSSSTTADPGADRRHANDSRPTKTHAHTLKQARSKMRLPCNSCEQGVKTVRVYLWSSPREKQQKREGGRRMSKKGFDSESLRSDHHLPSLLARHLVVSSRLD